MTLLLDNERHAWSQSFERLHRTCLHLEGFQVVLAIGLGGFPHGKRTLVFHVVHFHLDVFLESGAESGELSAYFHAFQLVFAHIERTPHIAHFGDAHNGRAGAYQFAHLGIYLAHFALYG